MPVDLNKIMQEGRVIAKKTKPELWDNDPKTMPISSKPTAPKTPKAWDQYQKVIDAHDGWDDVVNYGNSLHIMKAINGRYDKLLSNKEVDPETKEVIKTLINSSKGAMDELVKISNGIGNPKLFDEYRFNADSAELKISKMLGVNTNSNYVYDPDKKIIVDRTTYEINNPSPKSRDRTSTQANPGGGGVNPYAGFLQMKNYTYNSSVLIKKEINPLVTIWGKNAYNLFNSDDKVAKRYDPDNRKNTFNYTKDALTFISRYGTQSGDKNRDNQNKVNAARYLKKLNNLGSSEGWDGQLNYLKELSTSEKTNQITDMIEDIGYYGSKYLYNRYKKVLGKNEKYYDGYEKSSVNLDMIDADIERHETYMTETKKDKVTARKQAMLRFSDLDESEGSGKTAYVRQAAFEAAISNDGKIQSYHQFLKNLEPTYKIQPGLMGERKIQTRSDKTDAVYTAFRGTWDPKTGTLFYDDSDYHEVMRKAYNDIVKSYKKEFSLLNDPKKRNKDMGSGNTADRILYHDYVDMSLDKNGRMIKTQDYKGGNVAKIFEMMRGEGGLVNKSDITLIGSKDIENGKFSKANKDLLNFQKRNNEDVYNDFFKGADLSQMTVEFDRNASIDYHSTYTFINQKTGEKLMMVAPASYIAKNKETFWKETRMSTPEAIFQKLGKRDLPDKDGMYRDAAIIQKNGMKYVTFKYTDIDGITVTDEIPIGAVDINTAEKQFKQYFQRLQELRNKNSNL